MLRLIVILGVFYVASLAALLALGIAPAVPWKVVVGFVVHLVPLAVAVVQLLAWSEAKLTGRARIVSAPLWMALGLLLVWFNNWTVHPAVTIGLALFAVWHFVVGPGRAWLRPLGASVAALILGYGTVWNINYCAGRLIPFEALVDPALIDCDLAFYRWFGYTGGAAGMFPAVGDASALRFLEHAYMFYYDEIFATVFVVIATRGDLTRFFGVMFGCFLIGIPVFLLWPSVGPFTFLPETIGPTLRASHSWGLMKPIIDDYAAVRSGGVLQGFGYFIALPSMHVAIATVLQVFLWRQRSAFWFFLPINVLLILATFLLGFHYVLDAPAGLAVAAATLAADALIYRWLCSTTSVEKTIAGPVVTTPEGSQQTGHICWHPSGVQSHRRDVDRRCRCAQPPANRCHPSGVVQYVMLRLNVPPFISMGTHPPRCSAESVAAARRRVLAPRWGLCRAIAASSRRSPSP